MKFMKLLLLSGLLLFAILPRLHAHTIDYQFANMSKNDIGWTYLQYGFTHILPLGLDHILFVLCIFLFNSKIKSVLWQATAFTIAHSITLGLAMYGWIEPLPSVIEPIIALSIFFVAVENLMVKDLKPARIMIIFAFGLVHGMGFAGALIDLGLPQKDYFLALLTFNVGVELGQIAVIAIAYFGFSKWFRDKSWYYPYFVKPVSICIALIGLFWTIERSFFT